MAGRKDHLVNDLRVLPAIASLKILLITPQ
jgi:hypothetical protein